MREALYQDGVLAAVLRVFRESAHEVKILQPACQALLNMATEGSSLSILQTFTRCCCCCMMYDVHSHIHIYIYIYFNIYAEPYVGTIQQNGGVVPIIRALLANIPDSLKANIAKLVSLLLQNGIVVVVSCIHILLFV